MGNVGFKGVIYLGCIIGNNCVDIIKYGVRNSLVTCEPPTASSARVIGSNEAFEPFTSICS
jgi:hypothetical protein